MRLNYSAPGQGAAAYDFNRGVRGSVAATTAGNFAGRITGSLVVVGKQVSSAGDQTGSAALLLKTGVGGVPIKVNGMARGLTNPEGDLVLTGLTVQTPLELRVNEADSPIEISYRQASLSLSLPQVGVSVYDWRGNFVRWRWVQFRWSETEKAAYATAELPGGQQLYADEEGRCCCRQSAKYAVLRSEDGKRRCILQLNDAAKDFTCTP